jgi:hypothetical protein
MTIALTELLLQRWYLTSSGSSGANMFSIERSMSRDGRPARPQQDSQAEQRPAHRRNPLHESLTCHGCIASLQSQINAALPLHTLCPRGPSWEGPLIVYKSISPRDLWVYGTYGCWRNQTL